MLRSLTSSRASVIWHVRSTLVGARPAWSLGCYSLPMQNERWLRVFCQDLRVYDEQQARQGWTRSERDAWVAGMIVDARPELRRRGHSWAAFLEALDHESPRLRALAPN